MRLELAEPPEDRASLAEVPVHVVVRDYPEVLPVLRGAGVDMAVLGSRPFTEVGPEVMEAADRVLEWRRGG